jgi:hypothetical protein
VLQMLKTPFILVKAPNESQMALSTQVKESVSAAVGNLRDALAFAARSEHPIVINCLSDMLGRLETLEDMEQIMQHFNAPRNNKDMTPPFTMG